MAVTGRTPFLAFVLAAPGCGGLCAGPGCEDSFPAARLSLLQGPLDERAPDVWTDATGRYDGRADEGSSWVAGVLADRLLVGQPEATGTLAARVVSVPIPDGTGRTDPTAEWTGAGTEFGTSLAVVPTGEGTFDLWVGAPGYQYGKGAVHLFRDAHTDDRRDAADADLTVASTTANDRFGTDVVVCPDLTGDGLPEVAVTSPWFEDPEGWVLEGAGAVPPLAGAVFVLRSEALGTGDALPWEVGRAWWGTEEGEGAGHALACDDDLDGDGVVDLAIGAPWAGETRGRVYVVRGDPLPESGPLDTVAALTLQGLDEEGWFGMAVAGLTVDRKPALAIGAAGFSGGAGRVHLYDGRSLATLPARIATFEPQAERGQPDHLGRWLYAGDLDGDDRDDLVVGAPDYRGEGRNAFDVGRMWVWLGAGRDTWAIGGTTDTADHEIVGDVPFQRIGRAATVADADADGVDDLLVPTRAAAPEDEG